MNELNAVLAWVLSVGGGGAAGSRGTGRPVLTALSVPARSRLGGLLLVVLVAGCGGTAPNPASSAVASQPGPSSAAPVAVSPSAVAEPSAAPSPPASDLSAELVTPGRLAYCTNLRPGRMGFVDDSGKPAGVNVELAGEIARRLGLELDLRETPFDSLIDAVANGSCDISISSQRITKTRLERIDMLPYVQGTQHVIVRAGNPAGIVVLTDLCGRILAVQTGSIHADLVLGRGDQAGAGLNRDCAAAGRPNVDLRQFDDDADAIAALASGTADAYIGSDFITVDRAAEFDLATALPPLASGIGVSKDRPNLRAAVAGALQAMIADGRYLAILERFGVADLSIAN